MADIPSQYPLPPDFPPLLKALAREVIRYAPSDIYGFSRDYFTHMAAGSLPSFLRQCALDNPVNENLPAVMEDYKKSETNPNSIVGLVPEPILPCRPEAACALRILVLGRPLGLAQLAAHKACVMRWKQAMPTDSPNHALVVVMPGGCLTTDDLSALDDGHTMTQSLNHLDVDIITLDHRDAGINPELLAERLRETKAHTLGSNIKGMMPHAVVNVGPVKVGFLGLLPDQPHL
jgi:hypothetical protein